MTTLQEYLNNQYPTSEDKETVLEINLEKINQAREQEGNTDLLEGGEVDLRAFTNLQEVEIYRQFLKTPITKLSVEGLTKLKVLIWPDQIGDSEEEKKLWTELGIADLSTENNKKRKTVKEVRKLGELKGAQVHFGDKPEASTENNSTIYLSLDKKDKNGDFCSSLVFWTLAQELALISMGGDKTIKTPDFWKKFAEELNWVKENLTEDYQKDFELLLTPFTVPAELELSELYQVYFPNPEIANSQSLQVPISPELVDETWKTIKQELLELISEELKTNADQELLAVKLFINNQYIQVNYQADNPLRAKIENLLTNTPLKLEIEYLKKQQANSPTPENYEKLEKEKQELEEYLQENTDTDTYRKIQEKMSKK